MPRRKIGSRRPTLDADAERAETAGEGVMFESSRLRNIAEIENLGLLRAPSRLARAVL
jgi:hypothetical protein